MEKTWLFSSKLPGFFFIFSIFFLCFSLPAGGEQLREDLCLEHETSLLSLQDSNWKKSVRNFLSENKDRRFLIVSYILGSEHSFEKIEGSFQVGLALKQFMKNQSVADQSISVMVQPLEEGHSHVNAQEKAKIFTLC